MDIKMKTFNVLLSVPGMPCRVCVPGVQAETSEQAAGLALARDGYKEATVISVHELPDVCDGCENEKCRDCCEHNEREHYICNDCGKEFDPGDDIDRAYEMMRDEQ